MPDFQYQPPTGPLSGSEFERQTTQFFQQVSAAAGAASTAASAAQTTANEALERAQASNFVDGKTTRADAGGVITVKDVAIRGDLGDLASARGQIGPARELGNNVDFNTVTEAGLYLINAAGSVNAPRENQAFFLQVVRSVKGAITKNLFQIAYNYSSVADLVFIRQYRMASSSWSVWTQFITSSQVGDGLTVNNGIISVPEYEGATVSTAGTSGLVPPAAAGQHESFLTGGGEYKPALTKISDSVSLEDSKTAASAKAVKTAYDLANSKQANLGFTPVQQGGGTGQDNSKIYIGGSPEGLRVQMGATDLGNIVTTRAGITKANSATTADTAHGIGTHPWVDSLDAGGNPPWVMGLATDGSNNLRPFDPAVLRVSYAASAGIADMRVYATQTFSSVTSFTLPAGGSWLVIATNAGVSGGFVGVYAGGATVTSEVQILANCIQIAR